MGSATTDTDIALTKTVSVSGERLRVDYRIEPPDADAQRVQLVEGFADPVSREAVTFRDHGEGRWEYRNEHEVAFRGQFDGGDPIEATLQIAAPTLTPADCSSSVTMVPDGGPVAGGQGSPVELNGQFPRVETTDPAIGLVAADGNTEAVARSVIRATERGLSVFVATETGHETAARVAEHLGATLVQVDGGDNEVPAALAGAARNRSYPGLVLHRDVEEQIAFAESLERFETSGDAVTEAVVESARTNVLVGIPAYNEAQTVGDVVQKASNHVDEVLVVDDGSTDGTAEAARATEATVVEHDRNRGYGHALKTIFTEAREREVDSLVILDADDQHDTDDIPRLLEAQEDSGANIVIGSRYGQSAETDIPLYRRFGLAVITLLTNVSLGSFSREDRIRDTQSGFRAYDEVAVDVLSDNADAIADRMSASVDILSIASEAGLSTAEVPTTIAYDVENANTQNPVTHGLDIVNNIFKTLERKRPVTVLGIPGLLVALTGVGVGHWTVSNYITSGTVSIGLTLVAAALVLVGTLVSIVSAVQLSLKRHVGDRL